MDEELLRQQQEAYKVAGMEDEQINHPRERKKRKQQDDVSLSIAAPQGNADLRISLSSQIHKSPRSNGLTLQYTSLQFLLKLSSMRFATFSQNAASLPKKSIAVAHESKCITMMMENSRVRS